MRKSIYTILLLFGMFCLTSCSGMQKSNPYFYEANQVVLNANAEFYEVETRVEKCVEIKVNLIRAYERGKLYKFAIEPVGYLGSERVNIYFYVTNEQIYRIWSYVYQDGGVIEFYNDDELIVKYLNTDEKLVENGDLVFQLGEISAKKEDGMNYSISITENQVTYSRRDEQVNGETGFYEWFTWEKDKGLVDYGSGFGLEGDILYLSEIERSL